MLRGFEYGGNMTGAFTPLVQLKTGSGVHISDQ